MKKLIAAFVVVGMGLMAGEGVAQNYYTSGHADVGVGYDADTKEFEPHWHLGSNAVVNGVPVGVDTEFEPEDLIGVVQATRLSPSGLSSTLGVADGTLIFAAGSSTYQPNLGFGVEELDSDDWVGAITLTLIDWDLPSGADFALYTTNIGGTSVVDRLFSTYAPGSTDLGNSFTMTPGDHAHFQWGFTTLGTYTFEFQWSGTHVDDGLITTTASYTFDVVPEPSSALLLGVGGLGLWALRRRRI